MASRKSVQNRESASGRHLKYRACVGGPTRKSCPVKVSVAPLPQAAEWAGAVGAAARECVQNRESSGGRHLKYHARVEGAPRIGRPVEISVCSLNQAGIRIGAIRTASHECVQ